MFRSILGVRKDTKLAARLLDLESPGWYTLVPIDSLKMDDPRACVLFYVYGDYCDGLEALDIEGVEYNFESDTRGWKKEISRRLT